MPFAFVMLFIIVAWFKELRTDPRALRRQYALNAVDNAVVAGADAYGDDFALQVVPTDPGDGANGGIDSEHEDYPDWYQRTDENGEPVGFDYETGEWADGWTPDDSANSEESSSTEESTDTEADAASTTDADSGTASATGTDPDSVNDSEAAVGSDRREGHS